MGIRLGPWLAAVSPAGKNITNKAVTPPNTGVVKITAKRHLCAAGSAHRKIHVEFAVPQG